MSPVAIAWRVISTFAIQWAVTPDLSRQPTSSLLKLHKFLALNSRSIWAELVFSGFPFTSNGINKPRSHRVFSRRSFNRQRTIMDLYEPYLALGHSLGTAESAGTWSIISSCCSEADFVLDMEAPLAFEVLLSRWLVIRLEGSHGNSRVSMRTIPVMFTASTGPAGKCNLNKIIINGVAIGDYYCWITFGLAPYFIAVAAHRTRLVSGSIHFASRFIAIPTHRRATLFQDGSPQLHRTSFSPLITIIDNIVMNDTTS
jgi:hypothetical protein